jgi:hypothetical protein
MLWRCFSVDSHSLQVMSDSLGALLVHVCYADIFSNSLQRDLYSPYASSFRKLVVVLEAPQPEMTFQSADVTHHSQLVQSNEKPTTDVFLELIHGNDVKRF